MVFWIFVALLIVGIILVVIGFHYFNNVGETCFNVGLFLSIIAAIVVVISMVDFCITYSGLDGDIAANQMRYESLTYQYENDIYDNDNDLGKKELMNQIQEWNEDLARNKKNQDDFWIGIYTPNIYDQFEFIELTK